MRIAAVLLNTLHMILAIILDIFEAVDSSMSFGWDGRGFLEETPVLMLLACVFSGLGIFGSLRFERYAMYLSTAGLCFLWYLYLSEVHIIGLAVICCIVFVHVIFIMEMRMGIMTKDTYQQEEYIDQQKRRYIDICLVAGMIKRT